jgi:hypothetical protein
MVLLTEIAGIKKRNHKMLDYDSMRSKVKRLTEKPDKDPAKLPRTEKEQEMVSSPDFLYDYSPFSSPSVSRPGSMSVSAKTISDLGVPSPPKALNGIRQRFDLGPDEGELDTGTTKEDDDVKSLTSPRRRSYRTLLGRTSSILSKRSTLDSPPRGASSIDGVSPKKNNISATPASPTISKRSRIPTSTTRLIDKQAPSSIYPSQSSSTLDLVASLRDSASTRGATWPRQTPVSSSYSTPWFEPGELEDIMAPLKIDFMRRQADNLEQAKVAYDQLNEQLMSELPQLIDLRYGYPYCRPITDRKEPVELTMSNLQSTLPRPHIRSPRQDPTTLLRRSLQSHGPSPTVPRRFHPRPVRQRRSGRSGRGRAGSDSRAEYCGHGLVWRYLTHFPFTLVLACWRSAHKLMLRLN